MGRKDRQAAAEARRQVYCRQMLQHLLTLKAGENGKIPARSLFDALGVKALQMIDGCPQDKTVIVDALSLACERVKAAFKTDVKEEGK